MSLIYARFLMSRYCQGIVNNSKNNVKDKWQFFTLSRYSTLEL